MEERTYNIELTSSECGYIILKLFELSNYYKEDSPEDSKKINDLAKKIKEQFFEQGNL